MLTCLHLISRDFQSKSIGPIQTERENSYICGRKRQCFPNSYTRKNSRICFINIPSRKAIWMVTSKPNRFPVKLELPSDADRFCPTVFVILCTFTTGNQSVRWEFVSQLLKEGMSYNDLQWATMTYNELQWPTMGYNDLQWATMSNSDQPQLPTMSYNELQWATMSFNDLQWATMTYKKLQWAKIS